MLRREEDFIAALDEVEGGGNGAGGNDLFDRAVGNGTFAEEFAQVCPGAELHIELLRPDKVYEAVIEDKADLGFISYPEHRRDLTVIPWREERMTVAVYPSILSPNDRCCCLPT